MIYVVTSNENDLKKFCEKKELKVQKVIMVNSPLILQNKRFKKNDIIYYYKEEKIELNALLIIKDFIEMKTSHLTTGKKL